MSEKPLGSESDKDDREHEKPRIPGIPRPEDLNKDFSGPRPPIIVNDEYPQIDPANPIDSAPDYLMSLYDRILELCEVSGASFDEAVDQILSAITDVDESAKEELKDLLRSMKPDDKNNS